MTKKKDRQNAFRNRIGIVLVLLALIGGIFIAVRETHGPASSPTHAAAGSTTTSPAATADADPDVPDKNEAPSWYQEVSMQRIAELIDTAEHALIYYRSPT